MKWYKLAKENIPNYLTIARIAIVPIIVVLLLVSSSNLYTLKLWNSYQINVSVCTFVAAILFVLASLTDAIDGYLARKYNWISDFGKFWDPLADKILVNTVLFCLAAPQQNLVPIWVPIIILIRDIIIDGVRLTACTKNIVLAANIYGKIKTITLLVGLIFLLFFGGSLINVGGLYYWLIQNLLMYIATILSIISGIIYVIPLWYKASKVKGEE